MPYGAYLGENMAFAKLWEMEGLGKESTPAAVSDTSFYSCNTAM